jgi:hypothetical protein
MKNSIDHPQRLNMAAVAAAVQAAGFAAVVEHTGGNTATLYAGAATPAVDGERDRYQISAGPGYFDGGGEPLAWVEEFYVGPDDDDAEYGEMVRAGTESEAVAAILAGLRRAPYCAV